MRRHGFTLIELLVVIAIIAILAAILFPVFARAREKARQSSCQSNLKQLMLGLLMYAQDYDEKFPNFLWGEGNSGNPNSVTWFKGIYPYVKNMQLYSCPSSSRTNGVWAVWVQGTEFDNPNFVSSYSGTTANTRCHYGYNEIIGNTSGGLRMAVMRYPAEVVVLADCQSVWIGGYWQSSRRGFLRRVAFAEPRAGVGCGCPPNDSYVPPDADDHARHNGGSNIGFADGHVKWVKWAQCLTVSNGGSLRYYDTEW
ncbi:MAG: DUF1559 domain-containing protein [Armatimonadetes bacterium]|nr:DUF1559 domain-containing protein [Armatimonadota bacterium]